MINLTDIAPIFTFVKDKGLVESTVDYRPEEFGNAILVMEGKPLSLRFERDRGQILVDAGNDSVGWHKLEYVLEFVDNSVTQQQLGAPPNLGAMASLLQLNWDKVANLFSDSRQASQLREFAKQKTKALLNGLFRKSIDIR